jgi:hypothetical protein
MPSCGNHIVIPACAAAAIDCSFFGTPIQSSTACCETASFPKPTGVATGQEDGLAPATAWQWLFTSRARRHTRIVVTWSYSRRLTELPAAPPPPTLAEATSPGAPRRGAYLRFQVYLDGTGRACSVSSGSSHPGCFWPATASWCVVAGRLGASARLGRG